MAPAFAVIEEDFGLPNSAETLGLPLKSILMFVITGGYSEDTSVGIRCAPRGGRLAFVVFFFSCDMGRGGPSHIMFLVRFEGAGGLPEMSDGVVGGMNGCTGSWLRSLSRYFYSDSSSSRW